MPGQEQETAQFSHMGLLNCGSDQNSHTEWKIMMSANWKQTSNINIYCFWFNHSWSFFCLLNTLSSVTLVVKHFSSNSAVFVHIIFLMSFVRRAWYNTCYTTWDMLWMMKKPRARLCKQYAALPQRELWGGWHLGKVSLHVPLLENYVHWAFGMVLGSTLETCDLCSEQCKKGSIYTVADRHARCAKGRKLSVSGFHRNS